MPEVLIGLLYIQISMHVVFRKCLQVTGIAQLWKEIYLEHLLHGPAKHFCACAGERQTLRITDARPNSLDNWRRIRYSYSHITEIPANIRFGINSTLLVVHCRGVYEVVVLAFSSPETHGGWWKDLEKWSTYPCRSTPPLQRGLLEYSVAYKTNEETETKTIIAFLATVLSH